MFRTAPARPAPSLILILGLAALIALAGCSDDDDDGSGPLTPDTTPPAMVVDFVAFPGDGRVTLSWSNPTDGDWVGTMVRRDDAPPTGPDSGALVVDTTGDSYVDQSVTNDSVYIYAAYSYDLAGNFSDPAQATATPHEPIVVTFPDAELEQAMRTFTGVGAGDITDLDLLPLTELDLADRQIAEVTGLEWCLNLVELDLAYNDITDDSNLAVLADLPALRSLDLAGADLTSLSPLAGLTGLTWLRFDSPQVSDLTPLSSLTDLEYLMFADLAVTSLSPLAGLTGLETLSFFRCEGITTFADLAGLSQLVHLQAEDVATADLSPLATLDNLFTLDINGCQAHDIGDLMGLTQLHSLSLYRLPLLREAIEVQIPALEDAGVVVGRAIMIGEEIVGEWTIASITEDGTPVDIGEFLEWEVGAETAMMIIYGNATFIYEERDMSGTALYEEGGSLSDPEEGSLVMYVETVNGEAIQDYVGFSGTWAVDGDDLILTAEEAGSAIVMTWSR